MQTFQKLPANGDRREALRESGQFWTPPWLAKVMTGWVIQDCPDILFDPAVGPGTFFAAARELGFTGELHGFELHSETFAEGWHLGLQSKDFGQVQIADFISSDARKKFPAIISNPPYIRHHRLSDERKLELKQLAQSLLGFPLDGRVGLHIFFLLKCLTKLKPSGRLAFLLPADVCEGVSSSAFWTRICEQYQLKAVLNFSKEASPFPSVDTNAMVFLFLNEIPKKSLLWLQVHERNAGAIAESLATEQSSSTATAHRRILSEAVKTGLSRPPKTANNCGTPLCHFAKIVRGIATGSNEFFFLTHRQLLEFQLPEEYFRRAVGRTRDCPGDRLTKTDLDRLETEGRPTWLLNLAEEGTQKFPTRLQNYLQSGEHAGLPKLSLIKSRRPWYKMEKRTPPPILFAYLGRRDCRFILNEAGIVPLTGFLCVYPWDTSKSGAQKLWRALNHPDTLANLSFVAKSYGGGALKAEPRQLDLLEIPKSVMDEVGLEFINSESQQFLFDGPQRQKKIVARKPSKP